MAMNMGITDYDGEGISREKQKVDVLADVCVTGVFVGAFGTVFHKLLSLERWTFSDKTVAGASRYTHRRIHTLQNLQKIWTQSVFPLCCV